MSEERCAICNAPIPEGNQVCRECLKESEKGFIYIDEDEGNRYS